MANVLNYSRSLLSVQNVSILRGFHSTTPLCEIQLLSRLRVVDNSEIGKRAMAEGKPPRCIHVYNKTGIGKIGKFQCMYNSYVSHYDLFVVFLTVV